MSFPRRRSAPFARSELQGHLTIRRQRGPLRYELAREFARTRELVIRDWTPGLTALSGPRGIHVVDRLQLVRRAFEIQTTDQKLGHVGLGRQATARPRMSEIREIPS